MSWSEPPRIIGPDPGSWDNDREGAGHATPPFPLRKRNACDRLGGRITPHALLTTATSASCVSPSYLVPTSSLIPRSIRLPLHCCPHLRPTAPPFARKLIRVSLSIKLTNMSADTANDLTKVDSAVSGMSSSPPKDKGHRRTSSSAAGIYNILDLGPFGSLLGAGGHQG